MTLRKSLLLVCLLFVLAGQVEAQWSVPRGRAHLNAARTTFVADNGQLLRGPYTSTEWTTGADNASIANMKSLGFNAIHLYAEDFNTNYPASGTAPGYAVANVDRIVAATATNGLYLIITIGNGAYNGNYNAAYITNFWNFYAARYATNTHVLFEIQNEPVAWGPPYSSPTATPPGAINMEVAAYEAIRAKAPNTPVLLFTYAVFGGAGGASSALTDIQAFNTNVFGTANVTWTNEAVAFHGYAGPQNCAVAVSNLISAGYPCMMTEHYETSWGGTMTIFDAQMIYQLEKLGVSWLTFLYVPPSGVSADVTQPQNYSNVVNQTGISWTPDYGNWPMARWPYGNSGWPWTVPDYTNNTLAGTLHIEAENFDAGGDGVTYHELTSTNLGGQYRTNEAVDIEATSDAGGGYDVTGTAAGEWLEYTVWVSEPGLYNLKLRVAGSGGSVQFLTGGINGTALTGAWPIPNTGNSQTWVNITTPVFLTPGPQILHMNILTGGFNLNWIELTPVGSGVIANGTYKFLNRGNGLALQGVTGNGNLTVGSDTGSALQRWNLLHIGGNLYKITSISNSWSWSANGNGKQMGFVFWWGAGGNQCFYLQPTDSGYYRFLPVQDGLSVESASGNTVDEAIYSSGANQQWGIVAANAPVFPTGLGLTQLSSTQNYLTWNAVAGATSYNIKRGTSGSGPFTTLASGITTTNYTDANAVAGVSYYYAVSTIVGGVESLNSISVGIPLPYPWQTQDIGAVGLAGSAGFSNGVFTATGSGSDIWDTADAFRYLYLPVTGNFTAVARVASLQNVDPWTKAGIMIRGSTNANDVNGFIAVTPGNGVTWQYRTATNGTTGNNNTTGLNAPYWIKLVRSGNTFTAYRSPNGTAWTQQGSGQTIAMPSTAWIGLAVTAHNNSSLATAVFDNVSIPGWQIPVAPSVPVNLTANGGENQIALSWSAVSNAASYNIKRGTTSNGPYATVANVAAANYVDPGLLPGWTYFYVVSAVNFGGESGNSAPASATPFGKLAGGLIGSPGSWGNSGNTISNVFDANTASFYDAVNASGDWAGIDLGNGRAGVVTEIKYCPRPTFAARMVGGQFQGANVANFSSGVVTLFTIPTTPPDGTMTAQTITNATAFRYLRYLGPANGNCNVAEVEFWGNSDTAPNLAAVSNQIVGVGTVLTLTNFATDSDVPAQTLTFSLPTAPANAAINPASGVLTWRPLITLAGSTNAFTVMVTDSGTPGMSATQNFTVTVTNLVLPQVSAVGLSNGQLTLQVNGAGGPDYEIQASTNLADWSPIFTTNSPAMPFMWSSAATNGPLNFFRVVVGPPLP